MEELNNIQEFQNIGWQKPLELLGFNKRMVLDNFDESSMLDMGCGDGFVLDKLLKKNGNIKVLGLDISPVGIEKTKNKGLDCMLFDITQKLPLEDNSFDSVLLLDVLEHMYQPERVLKEAVRVASKYVYISVPNFVSLPARMQVLFGGIPENNTSRKGHTFWFTRTVLENLVNECGLKIEREAFTTFWESKPIIGKIMKFLAKKNPRLFSLAFAVKAKKI